MNSSLQTRKQLLLMESDLNRTELCRLCNQLTDELKNVTTRARSWTTVVKNLFSSFSEKNEDKRSDAPPSRRSWVSTLMRSVRLGSSLWLAFRSRT